MACAVMIAGGNLGNVEESLSGALEMASQMLGQIVECSAVYASRAWGFEAIQPFLNQVWVVETSLKPLELLAAAERIERLLGRPEKKRLRKGEVKVYTSRTMDIDILLYDDLVIDNDRLTVPHPLIGSRRFVLEPLSELMPQKVVPGTGKTVAEMFAEL